MNPRVHTSQVTQRDTFKLDADYVCPLKSIAAYIKIRDGFEFDGASLPRFCWSILGLYPMHAKVQAAAVVHDALYRTHLTTRYVADGIFYKLCRNDRLGWFRAFVMFFFLRLFGWVAWHNITPGVQAHARKGIEISTHEFVTTEHTEHTEGPK